MDGRRADRNADILAQIYFHLTEFSKKNTNDQAEEYAHIMRQHIELALKYNDRLGRMAEKGLI